MSARSDILTRLRQGLKDSPVTVPLAPDRPEPFFTADWDTLAESLQRVKAGFTLAQTPSEALDSLVSVLREANAGSVCLWDHPLLRSLGLADHLAGQSIEHIPATNCTKAARADAGITAADAVLPETGSIVVRALPGRPRSTSLVPPLHIALVRKEDMLPGGVDELPTLFRRWKGADGLPPSVIHVITGPSSTGDIELVHVVGVHGPVRIQVIGLDFSENPE